MLRLIVSKYYCLQAYHHLNTTLVKVNHALAYYLGEGHSDLNTTLVKVNQNENKRLNKRA